MDSFVRGSYRYRSADDVPLLIKHGADVNHEDIRGRAALVFAATSGSADVVSQLI